MDKKISILGQKTIAAWKSRTLGTKAERDMRERNKFPIKLKIKMTSDFFLRAIVTTIYWKQGENGTMNAFRSKGNVAKLAVGAQPGGRV